MPGRTPLGRALVVAGLVHLGLFGLAGRVRPPDHAPVSPMELVAIEVTPAPPEPEAPPPPDEPKSHAPADAVDVTTPTSSPRARVSQAAASPVGSAVALAESDPSPPGAWTLRLTTDRPATAGGSAELQALGLDGRNRFMGKRPTPEDEARDAREQANRAAGEAMRAALHDSDVEKGLGGGGPVVAALEAAVREGGAADESRAVLVAFADASGLVLRVDVESATDEGAFRTIADDVLQRLRRQRIRVPAGAHGLAMRVNVDSRVAPPSGGGAGLDARNVGGHFDLADLGARPRRVIHARVLQEQLL